MINKIYRLTSPRQISVDFEYNDISKNKVIVRPSKMSICAADQRYYTGSREKEILNKKLPMALIHEAVGVVVFDSLGEFKPGTNVALIPNTPSDYDSVIYENYLQDTKFRGSGFDGFMQEYIFMDRDRIVPFNNIKDSIASFLELISVVVHAINRFDKFSHEKKDVLAVWGDGNVGFITCLILKQKYPNSKIISIGKNQEKLSFFSFVDNIYQIDDIELSNIDIDHAFEAVGGKSSQYALGQIIDIVKPQASISLLGVSENPIEIDTRIVLEKGINLIGNSRSGYQDFVDAINLLEENIDLQNQLEKLISEEIEINSIEDINIAFTNDLRNTFKTVLSWNI